jgi:hypothetical protein
MYYFSIGDELRRIVRSLFEQLPSSETTAHFDAGIGAQESLEQEPDLASVENDGIELPNAEITEDLELPSVENDPSLTILPTNSEVSNLWPFQLIYIICPYLEYIQVLSEQSMDQLIL